MVPFFIAVYRRSNKLSFRCNFWHGLRSLCPSSSCFKTSAALVRWANPETFQTRTLPVVVFLAAQVRGIHVHTEDILRNVEGEAAGGSSSQCLFLCCSFICSSCPFDSHEERYSTTRLCFLPNRYRFPPLLSHGLGTVPEWIPIDALWTRAFVSFAETGFTPSQAAHNNWPLLR